MTCDPPIRNTAKSNLAAATASRDGAKKEYDDLQAIWVVETSKCDAVQKKYVCRAGACPALPVARALTAATSGWTMKLQR